MVRQPGGTFSMSDRILVVAAHPDDEVLGCGGTMARHVQNGDQVRVIFVADGVTSRLGVDAQELHRRQQATRAACDLIGVQQFQFLGFPDNRLDQVPLLDVVQRLEHAMEAWAPTKVYTHHHGDLNVDHRVTHQAVMTACRPLPGSVIRQILAFEVMSSTEWASPGLSPFAPNVYVDISSQLELKISALEAYGDEMRQPPHSRSVAHLRQLAHHRGNCVGFDAAEAFMLIRMVV